MEQKSGLKLPCKIVVCGDSISAGVCYDAPQKRYVKLKNGFVNALQSSLNAAVTNLSRFGNTVSTALPRLRRNLEREKPDIVLLELGGNDCDYHWDQIAADPRAEHKPLTDVKDFEQRLTLLSQDLRSHDIEPVMMTLPPIDADRYFKWVSKGSPEAGSRILEWLGSVTHIYWWHERYNAALLRVAEQAHCVVLDVRSAFLSLPDYRSLICQDGIHPTPEGQNLIARTIAAFLQENYPMLLKTQPAVSVG